jgi:hypothetical protein
MDNSLTKGLKVFLILLPLFLSTAWLISVTKNRVTVTATGTGLRLAPATNTTPIVAGLILFNLSYLVFIFLMFRGELKDFYKSLKKKHK